MDPDTEFTSAAFKIPLLFYYVLEQKAPKNETSPEHKTIGTTLFSKQRSNRNEHRHETPTVHNPF